MDTDNTPSEEAKDDAPAEGNVAEENVSDDNGVGAVVGTFAGLPAGNVAIADQGRAMDRLRQAGII